MNKIRILTRRILSNYKYIHYWFSPETFLINKVKSLRHRVFFLELNVYSFCKTIYWSMVDQHKDIFLKSPSCFSQESNRDHLSSCEISSVLLKIFIYSLTWLCQVLFAACGVFPCDMQASLSLRHTDLVAPWYLGS